jgi:hypothetical protein
VSNDDQPTPAVGRRWVPQLRDGPAEGLFEQPEGVLDVEAPQECLPASINIGRRRIYFGPPQPYRFGLPTAGKAIDGEPDDRAFDDGQRPGVVGPGCSMGQPWM